MKPHLLLSLLFALLTACGGAPGAATPTLPPLYFDLKGFLDGQRAYLESVSPTVTRTVRASDAPSETQQLARVNWERELHFFYEADLNKPALRGFYTTTTTALPGGAIRRTYQRRPGKHSAIRTLSVESVSGGAVRLVEAVQDDHNALFASERQLLLRCDPAPDHNRLLAYEIRGQQKLVFFDPTSYEVKAEIE